MHADRMIIMLCFICIPAVTSSTAELNQAKRSDDIGCLHKGSDDDDEHHQEISQKKYSFLHLFPSQSIDPILCLSALVQLLRTWAGEYVSIHIFGDIGICPGTTELPSVSPHFMFLDSFGPKVAIKTA